MSHGQEVNITSAPRATSGQARRGAGTATGTGAYEALQNQRNEEYTTVHFAMQSSAAGGVSFTHRQSSRDRPGGSCILPPNGVSRNGPRRQIGICSLVRLPARSFAQCALFLFSRPLLSFLPRKTPCPKSSSNPRTCPWTMWPSWGTLHCFSWTLCRTAHTEGCRP